MGETTHIAIAFFTVGSCFGQSDNMDAAVDICAREAKSILFDRRHTKPQIVRLSVYDYVPWDQIFWDSGAVYGKKTGVEGETLIDPTHIVSVELTPRKPPKTLVTQTYAGWLAERKKGAAS